MIILLFCQGLSCCAGEVDANKSRYRFPGAAGKRLDRAALLTPDRVPGTAFKSHRLRTTGCDYRPVRYPGFKVSSLFRGRHSKRALVAWFAVVVQLHIFLVLELHHHVLDTQILREPATQTTAWTRSTTAPAPSPLCPACQVARQGAVQPAVEGLALLPLQAVATALPAVPCNIPIIFLLHPSGRDPPLS